MYNVLIRLIFATSLLELGISVSKIDDCSPPIGPSNLQLAPHKVWRIDWRPIAVFPKEAARFKQPSKLNN